MVIYPHEQKKTKQQYKNLSSLSVIWLIYIQLYKEKEKNRFGKKSGLSGILA